MSYQSRIITAIPRTTLVLLFCASLARTVWLQRKLIRMHLPSAISKESRPADLNSGPQAVKAQLPGPAMQQLPQASPSPTPPVSIATSPDKMTQSEQGRQYGQAGFVGEPINLNVVNADIRDILNYITEQYGVNFVIDSSVRCGAGHR